jgi:hypothetical protein
MVYSSSSSPPDQFLISSDIVMLCCLPLLCLVSFRVGFATQHAPCEYSISFRVLDMEFRNERAWWFGEEVVLSPSS